MAGLYERATRLLRRLFDAAVDTPPVLDAGQLFPAAGAFVAAWPALRAEALALRRRRLPRFHELMAEQADISAHDGRDWHMFVLKAYGVPLPANLRACPALAALLQGHPEVLSATFSYLAPGKHIPRHQGPFRGVMRFQLGLSVPRDAAGRPAAVLGLADAEHRIGDGEALLWDDTFPHEVWNRSEQTRVALLLDVRRPALPAYLRLLSRLVIVGVGVGVLLRRRRMQAQSA